MFAWHGLNYRRMAPNPSRRGGWSKLARTWSCCLPDAEEIGYKEYEETQNVVLGSIKIDFVQALRALVDYRK